MRASHKMMRCDMKLASERASQSVNLREISNFMSRRRICIALWRRSRMSWHGGRAARRCARGPTLPSLRAVVTPPRRAHLLPRTDNQSVSRSLSGRRESAGAPRASLERAIAPAPRRRDCARTAAPITGAVGRCVTPSTSVLPPPPPTGLAIWPPAHKSPLKPIGSASR